MYLVYWLALSRNWQLSVQTQWGFEYQPLVAAKAVHINITSMERAFELVKLGDVKPDVLRKVGKFSPENSLHFDEFFLSAKFENYILQL